MYEDEDLWPVTCPRCGEHFRKKVGWLKKNHIMPCPGIGCGANLWYHPETFIQTIEEVNRAIEDFSKDLRAKEKNS